MAGLTSSEVVDILYNSEESDSDSLFSDSDVALADAIVNDDVKILCGRQWTIIEVRGNNLLGCQDLRMKRIILVIL